jgi:3-oxoacyl-[acyl-carrier protein] reductase
MDLGLRGFKAVVTGESSGIGLGIARTLAREGVHVGICARSEPKHGEAVDSVRKEGGTALGIRADVTNPADAQSASRRWSVPTARHTFPHGRVTWLPASAGRSPHRS